MGWDVAIIETGDGGDLTMNGKDVAVFFNDENEIYLRMFGGNVEADSKNTRARGEEDLSYWANKLLFNNDPNTSFNSLTERTLKLVALNSEGRVTIENAIKKDLTGLNTTVTVQVVSDDRIRIFIKNTITGQIKAYQLVRNPRRGDFDFNDFDPNDFY